MLERELSTFCKTVLEEVNDRIEAGNVDGGPYSQNAFTGWVMDYLSEVGMTDSPNICHYEGVWGRGQAKINISGFSFSEDEDRLDIFTTLYIGNSDPVTITKDEIAKSAVYAARFYEAACNGFHENLEPASVVAGLSKRVKDHSAKIARVRVFILTDGVAVAKKIRKFEVEGTPFDFEVFDLSRLFKVMQPGQAPEQIAIDFVEEFDGAIPCLQMPNQVNSYSAYLAIFPGDILFKIYDEYGPRILELNVRSFLSARGKVNTGIRKTLRESPDCFLAYNNGIVITVENIDTIKMSDGSLAIKSVTGMQIVNGGQTTASIHRAKKIDKLDISSVQVPAKITVIMADKLSEMVGNISKYANSQNPVQIADFSANEPFHVKIEELANTIWCPGEEKRWFYERARGSYQVALARAGSTKAKIDRFKNSNPPQLRFTKIDLAKYLNAWDQKPGQVSRGAQKNFDFFMQGLRNGRSDWLPDADYYRSLIAKAILWRSAHAMVLKEREAGRIIAQPANVTAYLVSSFSWATGGNVNFNLIWERQCLSESLVNLLRSWAHLIDNQLQTGAGGRMISEYAKAKKNSEPCWEYIKSTKFAFPEELPPELSSKPSGKLGKGNKEETISPDDFKNIEICKEIDGATWLAIHAWGKKTGELQRWQYGIAHTLAGYAAEGWTKGPSTKQARHGVAIIDLARSAGLEIGNAS